MNLNEIFKDGLRYPIENINNLVQLILVLVIISLINTISHSQSMPALVQSIAYIIFLLLHIYVIGITITIIKSTIYNTGLNLESFNDNFVYGIKNIIVQVIYFIIPLIITFVIFYALGGVSDLATIYNTTPVINDLLTPAITISTIIGIILVAIFLMFYQIAVGILSETDSISSSLNIKNVIVKITRIGTTKFIAYIILLVIISLIIGLISAFLSMMPYIGPFIGTFIAEAYSTLFMGRTAGLIYKESM